LIVIIQARSNSRRFNNKVLHKINNIPVIHHVIDNISKSKKVKKIIVAISKNKIDDKLAKYLLAQKIKIYRGDLNNVAKRLYLAAKKFNAKKFLRISADSPLIDHKVIDRAININQKYSSYDIITNLNPRTFPKGQSVEIIKSSIIKKNIKFMDKSDKEHVTKFFYKKKFKFRIKNFQTKKKYKLKNYCIDYFKDIKKIEKVMNCD
jgi:spore coat polysaccharide biosynthesis protein SpsF